MQTLPRLPMRMQNASDEYQAPGPFEVRPRWPGRCCECDDWEVARPSTPRGKAVGIVPAEVCICPDRETARAVCHALNATYPNLS